MGQAKNRGTFEERQAAAIKRAKSGLVVPIATHWRRGRRVELRPNTERLRVRLMAAALGLIVVVVVVFPLVLL